MRSAEADEQTPAPERTAADEAAEAVRRIAWARAARERATRATGRLLRAQRFSTDAQRRAAEARQSNEARRPVEPPG